MRLPRSYWAGVIFCVGLGFVTRAQQLPLQQSPPAGSGQTTVEPLSGEQIKVLIREVAEKDIENDRKQRNYTYVQREVEQQLDGKGNVKSTETKTYEVMVLYDEQVKRLVGKNDQPLSAKDASKEEQNIEKII